MSAENDIPWSAAFISYVIKQTPGITFPYNLAHVKYANAIRRGGFPWRVLPPFTNGVPTILQVGDIIIANRNGNTNTFTSPEWVGDTHGDIVVAVDRRLDSNRNVIIGATVVGGNLSSRVKKYPVNSFTPATGDYFVILRPNSRIDAAIIRDSANKEFSDWETNKWTTQYQAGARERVTLYFRAAGSSYTPPLTPAVTRPAQLASPTTAISPYITSLESFHPKIQYELTRRRVSSETTNTYMPFVKLTSLTKVKRENLKDDQTVAYFPSLGIHGENAVSFEDVYSTQTDKSIIAYAVSHDGTRTLPVVVSDASLDPKKIPIPGITQLTAERSAAGPMGVRGGLLKADVKIVAYSVGQVDALLRYFLRPSTRVVLELGRMSSNQTHPNEKFTPFDWKGAVSKKLEVGGTKVDISTYFGKLIKSQEEQEKFITQYVYNNYGNYEVFITYVVNFNLKYNKNNTFEIDLTLHSVQQFEVPTKHTGVQAICPNPTSNCKTMDIQEYFSDSYSWKNNSFNKLMSYYTLENGRTTVIATYRKEDAKWASQIIPIKNTNSSPTSSGAASTQAGTRENEYYVTWRFFVEKILNDNKYGIASMLGDSKTNQAISDLTLLRAVAEVTGSFDKGLIANQVGYHPNLRSVNPGVMLIYNPIAQNEYQLSSDFTKYKSIITVAGRQVNSPAYEDPTVSSALKNNILYEKLKNASDPFTNILDNNQTQAGAGLLSKGVWINTKAIKQAFTSTDTVSAAISMLLNMMNSATEGYWNLQLYSTDVGNPGLHVIDMGLSKEVNLTVDKEENESRNTLNSIQGISLNRYQVGNTNKPRYIYMFNRGTKQFRDGELGSDLLNLNVEFNMPLVVAVQAIANVGGPAQKGTLQSIDIPELQEITLVKDLYTECSQTNICDDDPNCGSDELKNLNDQLRIAQIEVNNQTEISVSRLTDIIMQNSMKNRAEAEVEARNTIARNPLYGTNRTSKPTPLVEAINKLNTLQNDIAQKEIRLFNPNLVATIREYADLGTALELIEINPSRMMKQLNLDSRNAETGRSRPSAHAFNSSNLTKTVVDVTIPGIGGINLFQSFLVDRIPSIIKKGFYVVTKVVHEFNVQSGWTTKIQGRFNYRPESTTASKPYDPCSTS